jgi:flagellar basal-body rod modification protein FlgD
MTSINAANDIYSSLGLTKQEEAAAASNSDPASSMGLESFFKLMITQLNNQDPTKPMDNNQFLSQIAQFGTVSGLDGLNKKFNDLSASLTSGQALQAGSMVGRQVLVPMETGRLQTGGSITGQVQLESSAQDVVLHVTDSAGQLIKELRLGPQQGGPVNFSWDGSTDTGAYAAPGDYTLRLVAQHGSTNEDLQTQIFADVDSVSIGANNKDLTLNLHNLGPVPFNQVTQIL